MVAIPTYPVIDPLKSSSWTTNFVGADRKMRELLELIDCDKISNHSANQGIKWNWNPPLGSHFGRVFESLVKVAMKEIP